LGGFGATYIYPHPHSKSTGSILDPNAVPALEAAAPDHVESVRAHLFDQLSPTQQQQLREICDALLDHLVPLAEGRGDSRARFLEHARAKSDGS
jgi:hypothetical protein